MIKTINHSYFAIALQSRHQNKFRQENLRPTLMLCLSQFIMCKAE